MIPSSAAVFLEMHFLHPFVAANLNCDDSGVNHKDIDWNGRRARISSQAFKRAMREWWRKHTSLPLGVRTSYIRDEIAKILGDTAPKEVVDEIAYHMVDTILCPMKDDHKTQSMLMTGPEETNRVVAIAKGRKDIYAAAEAIVTARRKLEEAKSKTPAKPEANEPTQEPAKEPEKATKKGGRKGAAKKASSVSPDEVKKAEAELEEAVTNMKRLCIDARGAYQDGTDALDVILFGRMLACKLDEVKRDGTIARELAKKIQDEPVMRVAHAIGTHRMQQTNDYFTAVDDFHAEHGADAASTSNMLGNTSLSSTLFYRYLVLNVTDLNARVTDKVKLRDYLTQIMRAATFAVPKGKQNSTAAHTHPGFAFFTVRRGCQVSLVNAFERPLPRELANVTEEGAQRLDREWRSAGRLLGDDLGVILSRVWSTNWETPEEAKKTIPTLASHLTPDFAAAVKDIVDAVAPAEHKNGKVQPVAVETMSAGSLS